MGALGNVTSFWSGLTGPARRLIIGSIVIFIVGLFLLMRLSGTASYSTLATADTMADAAALTKELDTKGIAYRTRDGGTTIQVASADLDKARLDLAASGLAAGGGGVGWSLFDKQGWGATDFTQRVNLQRALQGELSRTIGQMDPVRSAIVSLAMPSSRVFDNPSSTAKASVLLTLTPGASLSANQVTSITNLVAMAVPGLETKNVAVTDTQGNILSSSSVDSVASNAGTRMELESAYEQKKQSKLDAMLATIVGPGLATSQVDATLNLDQTTSTSEVYGKNKKPPKLDTDTTKETVKQSGAGSSGVAGASANSPGNTFPTTTGSNGKTDYVRTTDRTKNGVDRVVTNSKGVSGTLVRQSVSVQVDDTYKGDLLTLQKAVEAAVGYDAKRDTLSVQTLAFSKPAKDAATTAAKTAGKPQTTAAPMDIMGIAKTAGAAVGLLFILLMARKSLSRRQSELEKALPELLANGPVPVGELTAVGLPKRLEGETKSLVERQMEDLAMRKPDDMAKLMRSWLIERR